MSIYIIGALVLCMMFGGIAMVRPSKRDQQVSGLRSKALTLGWRVTIEKATNGEFVTVYRYQQKKKISNLWEWRRRVGDDFRRVPLDAKTWIQANLIEDERFYKVKVFPMGIELHWREFGNEEKLKSLLEGLLLCLNATNNAK